MSQKRRSNGSRSRSQTSNKKNSGGAQSKNAQSRNSRSRTSNRNRRRKNRQQAKRFWSDGGELPPLDVVIEPTSDPGAVVRSLGVPPLAGQSHKSSEYFDAIYARSVGLAQALAAAGELPMVGEES